MTAFEDLTGVERVRADAAARGLDVDVIERPAARSLEEAAELMGITPADIVKSLVVKRSDDTYVFALVPGGRKISWPKLRALLSVNKLQLPDASLALAATGYAIAILPSNVQFLREFVRAVPLVHRGASIGRWARIAWDPQRFQARYAEQFVEELAAHCRRDYPGRDLIRRAPPLPRPKDSAN